MDGQEYLEKNSAPVIEQNVRYAGFWIRFVAQIVDGIIYFMIIFIPSFGLGVASEVFEFKLTTPILMAVGILSAVLYWLYQSLFISSKYMATPGKMAVGIKVIDSEGNRVSFSRATMRYIVKGGIGDVGSILGYLLTLFNVLLLVNIVRPLLIPFNEKKQALHDMVAGTFVVYK